MKRTVLTVCLVLLLLAGGATALAAVGTAENPLVTLSYLTNTFTQKILAQTEGKITAKQDAYEQKLESKLQGSGSASYSVVSLAKGQTLTGQAGCEVLLRDGTAVCISAASGFLDTTTGGTLEGGQALSRNHLYLLSADTSGVKATSGVKLMVRGGYRIT